MASGTADLQRDFGGAIMTSIFGALLTAGYAKSVASQINDLPTSAQQQITSGIEVTLQKSYSSAAALAQQNPEYSTQIISAAKYSFLAGGDWAYFAGIIAILVGAAIVFFKFPKKDEEKELLTKYHKTDTENQ
jgi:MFS transporter, DHA2 family, multidrug resistance protein